MAGGAIVLFLLVDTFPGFAQNLFEKRQAVTGRFFYKESFKYIREQGRSTGRKKDVQKLEILKRPSPKPKPAQLNHFLPIPKSCLY
jgi:hypothetical protein